MIDGRTLAAMLLAASAAGHAAAGEGDWPQLQYDPAHTGAAPAGPTGPCRVAWHRDLGEPIATAAQPVAAGGRLFVGTCHGRLVALAAEDGKTRWRYETGGAILGSPAWRGGVVYVNSMDGRCHAVGADDGKRRWTFATGEGLWAAPVIAAGKVFVAGRDGFVYALAPDDGRCLWKAPVGGLVMCTPAFADGRLFVAAGDMRVYALDAEDGSPAWTSPKLPGAAIREYWLVASHGRVVLTTQLAYVCHHTQKQIMRGVLDAFNERTRGEPVLRDEQTFPALREWLEKHPHHRTLLVLDAATGKQAYVAPIITVNGGSCIGPPPTVSQDGWAYTVYANIQLGASGWAFFGRLNLRTGRMEPLITGRYAPKLAHPDEHHWQPKAGHRFARTSTWDGGFSVIDQSWGMSLGGDAAYVVRDPGWPGNPPFLNVYDIPRRRDRYLIPDLGDRREMGRMNLGTLGGGQMHNTAAPVIVAAGRLFHKTSRSVLFALEPVTEGRP